MYVGLVYSGYESGWERHLGALGRAFHGVGGSREFYLVFCHSPPEKVETV